MYVRFPLSPRNVEDVLFERGIDIRDEMLRLWWSRFGPMFAGAVRRKRVGRMRDFRHWDWHMDEMHVKLNGEMVYRGERSISRARCSSATSRRPAARLSLSVS